MKRIKVMQIQPAFNVQESDTADLAEQIVQAFPRGQFETLSVYLQGRPLAGGRTSRAERSIYLDLAPASLRGLRWRARRELAAVCLREQPDAVIGHRFKAQNMLMHLGRELDLPLCIGVCHRIGDYDRGYRRWQARRLIDHRWRMVGVSPAVRDYLVSRNCGFTRANTLAITNAIDVDQARSLQLPRAEARTALGLPGAPTHLIGTIGRLVPVKGHQILVEAFARIRHRFPEAHLAIIGGGPAQEQLERQIQALGVGGQVTLTGPRPLALRYARAFDLWVMPSLQEGLGLALLEGLSAGLPVIGSDVPAMRPILDGVGGHTVPPGDVDALARGLADLLSQPVAELRRRGETALGYLRAHHDIRSFRERYRQLVLEGLAPGPGRN